MGTSGKSMAVSRLSGCLLLVGLVKLASSGHSGFPTWLSNNLEEFENVAVSWDNTSAVPAWLKGTYFKNGPARQDFGGNLRYGNMADGWAKISKFNVDANGVRLSSKFLKTDTYRDCEEAREIVPQMTMGPVGVPGVWETLHLYRYPEGSLHIPEEIGKGFHIPYSTMIHHFSVTENYAIFFLYPSSIDMGCATMHLLHNMLECVKWHGDSTESLIYVVNLKTGETTNGIKTGAIYSTHHINAYEVTENELETVVVDPVIPPWYALKNFTDKDIMLNTEDTGSMENLFEIRRYQIDIQNERAFSSSWENNAPEAQPYYNQFDFPKVNPNYYGRHY